MVKNQKEATQTIPTSTVIVPPVHCGIDNIRWDLNFSKCEERRPCPGLLAEFARLWNEPIEIICKFAVAWGPLDLLQNDTKKRAREIHGHRGRVRFNSDIAGPDLFGEESVKAWRYLSHRVSAILQLAIDLREGRIGRDDDWQFISSEGSTGMLDFFGFVDWWRREPLTDGNGSLTGWGKPIGVATARQILTMEVNSWIRRFPFSLTIESKPKGEWSFQVEYFEQCLLSAVAYQLGLMLANADLFRCSGCGEPYLRSVGRKPKPGQANYCPRCARGKYPISLKRADERRNKRMLAAREMHQRGHTPVEIAKALKMTRLSATQTVQGWIDKWERGK